MFFHFSDGVIYFCITFYLLSFSNTIKREVNTDLDCIYIQLIDTILMLDKFSEEY